MSIPPSKYFALSLTLFSALYFTACEDSSQHTLPASTANVTAHAPDEIVTATAQSAEGKTLQMQFNNTLDTATVLLDGQQIELSGQRPADGIWYANSQYDLRGKGDAIELKKNGVVIFKSAAAHITAN